MQRLLDSWGHERPVFLEGDYLETMGRFLELEPQKPPRAVKVDASDIHELLTILESSQGAEEQLIQLMETLTRKLGDANVFLDVVGLATSREAHQPATPET